MRACQNNILEQTRILAGSRETLSGWCFIEKSAPIGDGNGITVRRTNGRDHLVRLLRLRRSTDKLEELTPRKIKLSTIAGALGVFDSHGFARFARQPPRCRPDPQKIKGTCRAIGYIYSVLRSLHLAFRHCRRRGYMTS